MRSLVSRTLICAVSFALSTAFAADPPPVIRAVGADGKALNLDFETGDLRDWKAEGEAFKGQPIKGDSVNARRGDMHSEHAGDYWIGTFEQTFDEPQGTLTSVPFKVTHPWATFLIAGGPTDATCVEVVVKADNKVVLRASGHESENLERVAVDLEKLVGQEIYLRVIDKSSGGWGHINFDDFQFHAAKPNVNKPARSPADLLEFAGLSPEDAAKAMKVPAGFSVTAFAGEPDVQQPIAMSIDDRGRLWVAEAYSYPIKVKPEQARDRILIFEDTNSDGKFDTRKVFVEKLNLISGMELGFGGVWVGAAPELLFIPDRNRDDVPDGPPEVLLDGWGAHDTHETLNSFIWGPDGWLYGCHGVFTHSLVGKPGTPKEQRTPFNAGIFRFHPTRHVFEIFAEGTSNPWGVDFNDHGQAFLSCCVIPHLFHVVQGGRFQRQAGWHFNDYTYADIPTIAKHRHWVGNQWNEADRAKSDANGGGHAHAGAMIYLGGLWPKEYRNQLFMNNIHGARLNEDLLTRKGSGYVGDGAPDFCLTNDRWSQILYLRYGPDGNVYMIDWYDQNQCHHGNSAGHDRSNGRIFKISYAAPVVAGASDEKSAAPVSVAPQDLQTLSDVDLVQLLTHKNDYYVRGARRILQERTAAGKALANEANAALVQLTFNHADETRRLRGLWALHATGGLTDDLLHKALLNDGEHVRAWAVQLACEQSAPSDRLLSDFSLMARTDRSAVVRMYLATALQRLPLEKRWDTLVGLLSRGEDGRDHNIPLMLWYATEPLAAAEPSRALEITMDGHFPLIVEFAARRIAALNTPESLDLIVDTLSSLNNAEPMLPLLTGLQAGLRGRRQVPMPKGWKQLSADLAKIEHAEIGSRAESLSVTFGDEAAMAKLMVRVADSKFNVEERRDGLESLIAARYSKLPPVLNDLLADVALRRDALRGLAAFDDPHTPELILPLYPIFNPEERRDALNTLASRAAWTTALLKAVGQKLVPANDLTADLVRQMRNLKNPEIDQLISDHWGVLRDSPADKAKQIAEFKKLLSRRSQPEPDRALGRAVFTKVCAQCHTLFNAGGKVGPDITGSNRKDLEYLLSNVLDPSAVVGKDYIASIILTTGGRTITGLVKSQDANALTIATANETLILPRSDIDEMKSAEKSVMPDDLLKPLSEYEVRSLVAYIQGDGQVPLLATAENALTFFNGKDLTGWDGDPALWKVDNGEIVGTSPGLKQNVFLKNQLLVGDFRLTLQVKLLPNDGNSGIQFRSEPLEGGEVKGYQADVGAGWWGKLYEEHGRGLIWPESGEAHVRPGEWNDYEVVATGSKIRTFINGKPCVDLDDPVGARLGIFALQLHSGGAFEVRYRKLKLEVGVK